MSTVTYSGPDLSVSFLNLLDNRHNLCHNLSANSECAKCILNASWFGIIFYKITQLLLLLELKGPLNNVQATAVEGKF